MTRQSGRGRSWDVLVATLKARHPSRYVCCLCGRAIQHELRYPEPMSFSADHILPVATHPELKMDYSNLQPAHLRCNLRKGDRPQIEPPTRRHYRARIL